MNRRAGASMLAAASMLAMMGGMPGSGLSHGPAEKPERPCLLCGKPHQHNNCWCSAECCREWRRQHKGNRRLTANNNARDAIQVGNMQSGCTAPVA